MNREILLLEDEHDLRDLLAYLFETQGYEVVAFRTAEEALKRCRERVPDIVVLDVALPDMNGLEVCRRLPNPRPPVLILSALDRDDQVIAGLKMGADDYVRKPFNHQELLLRIQKLLDRHEEQQLQQQEPPASKSPQAPFPQRLEFVHVTIDLGRREVYRGGKTIPLTPTEARLLRVLAEVPGYPVMNAKLLERVWESSDWTGADDLIKVNIRRLRKKIEEDPKNPKLLVNRRGLGYFLAKPALPGT